MSLSNYLDKFSHVCRKIVELIDHYGWNILDGNIMDMIPSLADVYDVPRQYTEICVEVIRDFISRVRTIGIQHASMEVQERETMILLANNAWREYMGQYSVTQTPYGHYNYAISHVQTHVPTSDAIARFGVEVLQNAWMDLLVMKILIQ